MEVVYTLSARYPQDMDIVFPDSTYNFAPFEFERKEFFPTQTDSLYSYDSAVYYLTTFEIDSIQYLQLPVYVVSEGDSNAVYTEQDFVVLQHVVAEIPDTVQVDKLPLKENISYLPLELQFNYPYLIIAIIILLIVAVLIFIIFGKRMRKWWQLKKLRKRYRKFKERFNAITADPHHNRPEKLEKAVVTWKTYMEKISDKPYRQLTTKEIFMRENNESLKQALRKIDRSIYSGKPTSEELEPAYQELDTYADKQYNQRVEEIKNV